MHIDKEKEQKKLFLWDNYLHCDECLLEAVVIILIGNKYSQNWKWFMEFVLLINYLVLVFMLCVAPEMLWYSNINTFYYL